MSNRNKKSDVYFGIWRFWIKDTVSNIFLPCYHVVFRLEDGDWLRLPLDHVKLDEINVPILTLEHFLFRY